MLRADLWKRTFSAAALGLLFLGLQNVPAVADGSDGDDCLRFVCDEKSDDGTSGTVTVGAGPDEQTTGGDTSTEPGGSNGSGGKRVCTWDGQEIPCDVGRFGTWDGRCYIAPVDPQPPKTEEVWEGHEDGVILLCVPYICIPGNVEVSLPEEDCAGRDIRWAPADPNPGVDAVQLAERAVDQMGLSAIEIGIVPDDEPGKIGYVGMPVWMWARDPGPSTTDPIEASASAGGYTVTARATVDRIEWDMGNGEVVSCTGPGTPYEDRFGVRASPDCGYEFPEQGDYTVTARSFWTITWEGVGQEGTLNRDFARETQIRVGELQVLTQ